VSTSPVPFRTITREWGRLGLTGFGGPPAHIALLRRLCVETKEWLSPEEFEHAIATTGLLPGPASTQLAIYCAWRLRGVRGALLGGALFILPGLLMIVGLSALFFAHHPSRYVLGAALGAGAVVPAIAASTAFQLARPSWRSQRDVGARWRWGLYVAAGAIVADLSPAYVVVVLVLCGLVEILRLRSGAGRHGVLGLATVAHTVALGSLGALAWLALKVGALSYGGGFVIVPLMQHDVVSVHHWMSGVQFLNAVALGQVTPGPVVLTVAAVGYAAHGLVGAGLATLVAFGPSFVFIIAGGSSFERLRQSPTAGAFLRGAGPSVIGAIGGSAVALGLLLAHLWQVPLLVAALVWFFWRKGSPLYALLVAALIGAALVPLVNR